MSFTLFRGNSLNLCLRVLPLALMAPLLIAQPSSQEAEAEATAEAEETEPQALAVDVELETGEETESTVEPTEAAATDAEVGAQPELVEDLVDQALRLADLPAAGNTKAHFIVAAAFLLLAILLRGLIARLLFRLLHALAVRTRSEFDDYIVPAIETSVRALILLIGVAGALMVLKLPPAAEVLLHWAYLVAVSLVFLVFFLRLTDAVLEHLGRRANKRQLNVVSFMPWIRRVVLTVVFLFGVLMIAQWLGGDVRSFLAGLGIGGLAVALAAQDTLANVFGSIVVAVDQPFRLGEFVQIGAHSGTVEDIGLRSTRLRTAQGNLVTIPNRTVANESIVNLTRFVRRRVEQTLNLTYDATPEQMDGLVEDIREILLAEDDVEKTSVIVQFTELGASSLNLWLAYNTPDPDFIAYLKLKQKINLAIIRAVAARGMSFAFPTQSLHVESWPQGDGRPA